MPEHDIAIPDGILGPRRPPLRDRRRDALAAGRLHGVLARGEVVVVLVPRHPDSMLGELGATCVVGGRVREQHLAVGGEQLVADGCVGCGVANALVEEFEGAVGGVVEVVAAFAGDGGRGGGVADAERIVDAGVVDGEGVRFFDEEGVGVAVEGGVDAQAEEVLVVWRQNARSDFSTIWQILGVFETSGRCGENACGADFVVDGGVLAEVEGEDVLVVGNGDDGLENQDSGASYDGILRSEVGVFPQDAVVLLVAAHDVW